MARFSLVAALSSAVVWTVIAQTPGGYVSPTECADACIASFPDIFKSTPNVHNLICDDHFPNDIACCILQNCKESEWGFYCRGGNADPPDVRLCPDEVTTVLRTRTQVRTQTVKRPPPSWGITVIPFLTSSTPSVSSPASSPASPSSSSAAKGSESGPASSVPTKTTAPTGGSASTPGQTAQDGNASSQETNPAASGRQDKNDSGSGNTLAIGLGAGLGAGIPIIAGVIGLIVFLRWRRKKKPETDLVPDTTETTTSSETPPSKPLPDQPQSPGYQSSYGHSPHERKTQSELMGDVAHYSMTPSELMGDMPPRSPELNRPELSG